MNPLSLVALVALISAAFVGSDTVYTENGSPISYALEEEILEHLARDNNRRDENASPEVSDASKPIEEPSNTDDRGSDQAQEPAVAKPKQPPASTQLEYDKVKLAAAKLMKQTADMANNNAGRKFKKEGQEEFATFVDPFLRPNDNRRMANERNSIPDPTYYEKRAQQGSEPAGEDLGDTMFIAVTTVCSAAAVFGLIAAGVCWYRLHRQYKAAQDVDYPHYGVTGPAKERTSGSLSPVAAMDAKLASSAQLYHYQHTKQQIIAMEQSACDTKGQESEDSEAEGDEGDFSVYECPGLAPTGDIEVSNPLFENAGVASPQTKSDPRLQLQLEFEQPGVHQRSPGMDAD